MSSVTGSRRTYVAPRRGLRQRVSTVSVPLPLTGGLALGAALTVAIGLCAFVAEGGSQLERTTWVEVGLMLAGAGVCALAIVVPRDQRTPAKLRGVWVLLAFAALAALTTLAISWSLAPGQSWLESSRTLSYLAALAAGVALARLAPARWNAVLAAVIASALAICGWSLLTKVFPAALAPDEPFARLRPPFGYWNSVGLAAALGIVPLLWLAVRRSGHAAVNALAWPALGLLTVCLLLAYSRGALLVVGLGIAVWVALVPLRLRSVVVLGGVLVTTLPVVAWAFAQDGLSRDEPPLSLRVHSGLELGALLLLLATALAVAGLAVGFLSAHRPPAPAARRRAARALVLALAVVPAVAILMLANSPGGIGGQVSKAWHQATDPNVRPPSNAPDRLSATSSVRARYWSEAFKVHDQSPWLGTGPGSYATQRLRYRIDRVEVQHAHGYVVQTLADLGWIGLGLSVLAALVWLATAARALGMRPRDRGLPWDAERVGLAALALTALVFGAHSAIDWTWYVPGNAVVGLLCAGWVAGRGPLRERLGPAPPPREGVGFIRPATAALVVALALAGAWSALQPVRSAHAEDAAYARLAVGALPQAAAIAQIAHERDPLALDPLFDIATVAQARGRNDEAQRALEQAVRLETANAETWRRLGEFQLYGLNDPRAALRSFGAAFYLDKRSAQSVSDFVLAQRALNGG